MKKKTFLLSLCLCLMLAFTGCSKNDSTADDNSTTENTTVASNGEVTLGEYKGIEVVMESLSLIHI